MDDAKYVDSADAGMDGTHYAGLPAGKNTLVFSRGYAYYVAVTEAHRAFPISVIDCLFFLPGPGPETVT